MAQAVISHADNSKPETTTPSQRAIAMEKARVEENKDSANWEYVTIPERDLFGDVNNGITINFEKYGPGKHYVNPEIAYELRRMLDVKLAAEMRIMQPGKDQKMMETMKKSALGAPTD